MPCPAAAGAFTAERHALCSAAGAPQEVEEDDLDALLDHYEAEARAALPAEASQARGGKRARGAAERRAAALAQPLGADNRGFQLLAAQGYRPGQALGRAGQGRLDPLPLALKQDKVGLGGVSKKAAAREAAAARAAAAAQRAERDASEAAAAREAGQAEFAARLAAQRGARRAEAQLRRAAGVCQSLDTAAGVAENFMWAPPPAPELGLEQQQQQQQQQEELREGRLRYEVPPAADGHDSGEAGDGGGGGGAVQREPGGGGAQVEAWLAMPAADRLAQLLGYLRSRHLYCLYCGCGYRDQADLGEHCPGPSEADHDG